MTILQELTVDYPDIGRHQKDDVVDRNLLKMEHMLCSDEWKFMSNSEINRQTTDNNPFWIREDYPGHPVKVKIVAGIVTGFQL